MAEVKFLVHHSCRKIIQLLIYLFIHSMAFHYKIDSEITTDVNLEILAVWYGCNRIKFQKSGSSPYNTSDLRFNLYLISRYIHSTKNLPSLIFWQSWNLLLLRISKLSLLFTFVKVEAEIVRVKDTRDHFQVHIYMHYKENENWRWPLVSLT